MVYDVGDRITHVYFPKTCVVSTLAVVDGGSHALAITMIGSEGMLGVAAALGAEVSSVRMVVHHAGAATRMPIDLFRDELPRNPSFQRAVRRYGHGLMQQIVQAVACNHFHNLESRLARWLLLMRDRLHSSHFHSTHDFLASMLGVQREGVTNAARAFKTPATDRLQPGPHRHPGRRGPGGDGLLMPRG